MEEIWKYKFCCWGNRRGTLITINPILINQSQSVLNRLDIFTNPKPRYNVLFRRARRCIPLIFEFVYFLLFRMVLHIVRAARFLRGGILNLELLSLTIVRVRHVRQGDRFWYWSVLISRYRILFLLQINKIINLLNVTIKISRVISQHLLL